MATDDIKSSCIVAVEDIESIDTSSASSGTTPDTDALDIIETQTLHQSLHESNVRKSEQSNRMKSVASLAPEACPLGSEKTNKRKQIMEFEVFGHVILALLACMFLVFACLAASVDHTNPGSAAKYKPGGPVPGLYFSRRTLENMLFLPNGSYSLTSSDPKIVPKNSLNEKLLEAAKLGPTIFPILFAAIIGGFLRLVARWRAEKASTVEELELLVGSRSLASTVTTLFSLRTFGIIQFTLIILWVLSPIAGQASVRILSSGRFTAGTLTEVPWFATDITAIPMIDENTRVGVQIRYITGLMQAKGSITPVPGGATAAYNFTGLMIPMIALNESGAFPSGSSEYLKPDNSISLVGVDIIGPVFFPTPTPAFSYDSFVKGSDIILFDEAYINFTISYFEFNCPSVTVLSTVSTWLSTLGPDLLHPNGFLLQQQSNLGSGFFILMNSTSAADTSGQNITFGSFYDSKVTLWNCVLSVITRDISALCNDDNYYYPSGDISCGPTVLVDVATASPITPFSNSTLASNVFGQWTVIDPASVWTSSLTEQYLAQGANFTSSLVDLSSLDNQTFSARLTRVFNTYVQTRQPNSDDYDFDTASDPTTWLKDTSHNQFSFMPIHLVHCNWIWFAILTSASTILIVCSSLNVWLSHRLSTPDIMGYVSTLIQDHLDMPDTGKTSIPSGSLDGLDRAKLLKRVRVQIRDVGSDEETGQFALTRDIKILPNSLKGEN